MLHDYPGINLDLRHYPQEEEPVYPIGASPNCWGTDSALLPIREVFMMVLMDRLTDKVDWHKKVFDEEIVAKWRKEALEQPEDQLYLHIIEGKTSSKIPKPRGRIISEAAFDYCIKELREKAADFDSTGLVHTLDSVGNTVVKSDTVVTSQLQKDLRTAFDQLRVDQASDVDWHPRSGEMVQDLVHPSMYPFIYGKSNFLQEEVVGVSDAVEVWAGKGETAPEQDDIVDPNQPNHRSMRFGIGGSGIPPEYWSNKYQWLPANLAFQEDGTVKFTSYINNLHPKKYPEIYRTIERLVDTAIPAWDRCLTRRRGFESSPGGRQRSRFSQPESCEEEDDHLWEPFDAETRARHDAARARGDYDEMKWMHIREPLLPEPDDVTKVDYLCKESLRETFKATGLQIIVKMATIELTPEKPEFPVGGWHVEGQMNERICATALYYLDSENVTPSHLSFRMQTSSYQDDLQDITGQDAYNWLERVYGTALGPAFDVTNACLQSYGSVETQQGRLLAFPNTFQHRVSPFKLQDPTKPGHRRFIALWLVDPHQRIVSTANVPPQQLDWWAEAVFGTAEQAKLGEMPPGIFELLLEKGLYRKFPNNSFNRTRHNLPPEILDMVRKEGIMPKGLISAEEARQHQLELINIRSRFHKTSEDEWEAAEYSFCEH
ncbi:hypothetical protein AJ80_06084 [Polytolypa hystricis UAMH7299]|uniref:Uncharacterized protein n=1 Tax=Polytolypa hystricis (strain UAMH7299) TaxID=1447883 RepID=A0A2B7XYH8_POLH7|nr:hypothetical protein AJ80_06084 [Polytolypa hystricis UAMH7299]